MKVSSRAIWSGSLSFGLVNIPIKLYSAVSDGRIDFDMLHKKDLSPIRFARICKLEEVEVPYEEIVRGYEYEKGQYVVVSDDDFERANIRLKKTITILDFVDESEIDSSYYEKPYYVLPDEGALKPYSLLHDALMTVKKVGVGHYVLRNREDLVLIRAAESGLILENIRFRDEIRDAKWPKLAKGEKQEMEMALLLIDRLSKKWNPENYKDTYTEQLKKVIVEKIKGNAPTRLGEAPKPTAVPDLMETLRRSLEKEKQKTK